MTKSTCHRYRRRGISIVAVVVSTPLMLGTAALVVDVAYMNSVHTDLRRTADAASLAGVSQLAKAQEQEEEEGENHVKL